jgi:hypothetical protein
MAGLPILFSAFTSTLSTFAYGTQDAKGAIGLHSREALLQIEAFLVG